MHMQATNHHVVGRGQLTYLRAMQCSTLAGTFAHTSTPGAMIARHGGWPEVAMHGMDSVLATRLGPRMSRATWAAQKPSAHYGNSHKSSVHQPIITTLWSTVDGLNNAAVEQA
jgi:hypothetical protein